MPKHLSGIHTHPIRDTDIAKRCAFSHVRVCWCRSSIDANIELCSFSTISFGSNKVVNSISMQSAQHNISIFCACVCVCAHAAIRIASNLLSFCASLERPTTLPPLLVADCGNDKLCQHWHQCAPEMCHRTTISPNTMKYAPRKILVSPGTP